MLGDVPRNPSTIDRKWLTDALELAGVARGATVTLLRTHPIGTGQVGRIERLSLTWDQPQGRPASLIAKFPSADRIARATGFANGAYANECNFYSHVARTVRIRTPTCWVARYDEAAADFVLVLEDLHGYTQGDQIAGLTVDQTQLAIEQAVALHSPRWGDPTVSALGPTVMTEDERAKRLSSYYRMCLKPFVRRLGPFLDQEVIDLAQRLAPNVGDWTRGTGTPDTIVHYDFRPDNFLFGHTTDSPPLAVIDWQTVNSGLGMSDVAYLIGGAFVPQQRAAHERDLVDEYRRRLVAAGVDYDASTCLRDYRFGSLWGLMMSVIATMMTEKTHRGNEMLAVMAQRHGRHALDLEALALLH
jgi:hypothetical protein